MAVSKPSLMSLIQEFRESEGAYRMMKMVQIQSYLNTMSLNRLFKEIDEITDKRDLRIVIGAGPSGQLYMYVMQHYFKLR